MRLVQVREILSTFAEFHGQLAVFYGRLAAAATEPRVQLLLDYRSKREIERQQNLAGYEDYAVEELANAYVECRHARDILDECRRFLVDPELTIAGVTNAAMRIDLCLLRVYTAIAATAESAAERDLFTKLAESEETEIRKHARNARDAAEL